jgi:hypothetical protein
MRRQTGARNSVFFDLWEPAARPGVKAEMKREHRTILLLTLAVAAVIAVVALKVTDPYEPLPVKLFYLFVRFFPADAVVLLGFFLYLRDRHKH